LFKTVAQNDNAGCHERHSDTRKGNTFANALIGAIDGLRKSCPVVHCVNPFLKTTLKVIIE
jgi:hypothetical protein